MTDTNSPAAEIDVDGRPIAFRRQPGANPGLVWLGGYRSDMLGTKAETLAAYAQENKLAFCRHDYSGHGQSGGAFREGTISRWLTESLAVFDHATHGPQILVGSSMGAWIALRMLEERGGPKGRVAGLVLLAPAPDFTRDLVEPRLTDAQREALARDGFVSEPSEYGPEPTIYTRALLEDGHRNLVLDRPIHTFCPVHIIQGLADPDVPHTHALKLASLLPADDLTLSLVPGGDHRLSREEDLDLLRRALDAMRQTIRA